MPLNGLIPDTPPEAHLVFEIQGGATEDVARGLAAAQVVFVRHKIAPHLAYMAMQEVAALSIDVSEASSLEYALTGEFPPEDTKWNQLCDEADIWDESLKAALAAACQDTGDQKIYFRYFMDWDGNALDASDKVWWPHRPFAGTLFDNETSQ